MCLWSDQADEGDPDLLEEEESSETSADLLAKGTTLWVCNINEVTMEESNCPADRDIWDPSKWAINLKVRNSERDATVGLMTGNENRSEIV